MAGVAVGTVDVLLSWGRIAQFLRGAGGKLACLLHVGTLQGAAAALITALIALAMLALMRGTVVGPLVRGIVREHQAARARDPRSALWGLGLAMAAVPSLAAALHAAWTIGMPVILHRHHKGLIVAVVVAATAACLLGAFIATLVLGRILELGMRWLCPGRVAAVFSHAAAPGVVVLVLLALVATAAWVTLGPLLAQLHLRPYLSAAGTLLAVWITWNPAGRVVARLAAAAPTPRAAAHAGLVGILLFVALATGRSDAVRKGATAGSGLGGPLAIVVRSAADLDRDGYSSVLGGGDCDDFRRDVHPGAPDFPDDGVDQNCMGGDVRLSRQADDARFVPVPGGIPRDVNVLLMTIDTLRADHVSAYGYGRPTTPVLDALAGRGTLFENAWAHAPSTRYSIPAILTGRYPSKVSWDMSVWWPALRPENRTMAEVLKDVGFTTGAILNYHYFDRVRRMDQGFDEYDNSNSVLHQGRDPASTRGSSSQKQADAAIRFLERHASERFFLWLHFYDPHFEYERHPGTPDFGPGKIDLYDHEIRFNDEQMGRVVARLQELGLESKTIIAVTGDHGEGFGEHGIDFHGYHLYAAQTRVPLVIVAPGLAPKRLSMPVGHVDLLPTLANLAGAPPEASMMGRSLLGEMAGSAPDGDREVFQEVSFEGPTERRAVATRSWHLLYNMVPDNTFEMYDLARDPLERHDLSGSVENTGLRQKLLSWIDESQFSPEAAAKIAAAVHRERPRPGVPIDADFGDAVRLLGIDLGRTEARAGDDLEITWYFECKKPVRGSWRMFVHVEGPSRFLGDHDPVDGVLPFSRFRTGQFIADRQSIRVPPNLPSGEYTIYAGLFQGPRRMAVGGVPHVDNRVRIASIRVVP